MDKIIVYFVESLFLSLIICEGLILRTKYKHKDQTIEETKANEKVDVPLNEENNFIPSVAIITYIDGTVETFKINSEVILTKNCDLIIYLADKSKCVTISHTAYKKIEEITNG